MACGMSGTGKSALLNGICGESKFQVTRFGEEAHVTKCKIVTGSSTLILTEVSGFEGDTGEDEHLEDIKRKCADVDLMIYCVSVNSSKIKLGNDQATLIKLKSVLDKKVCEQCVIVLTFANTIVDGFQAEEAKASPDEIKEKFVKSIEKWKRKVLEAFSQAEIENSRLPVVCTGIATKLHLTAKDSLPWLSTFWNAIREMPPDQDSSLEEYKVLYDKKLTLILVNLRRIESKIIPASKDSQLYCQPLIIALIPTFRQKLRERFPTIASALAVGSTGGVAGAGVGALIGALAIGIPSFGAAAGAGMVIGGAVGGAVGIGAGAATAVVVDKVRKSE